MGGMRWRIVQRYDREGLLNPRLVYESKLQGDAGYQECVSWFTTNTRYTLQYATTKGLYLVEPLFG